MPRVYEYAVSSVRSSARPEESNDEALSRWLLSGKATEMPPVYGDPEPEADKLLAIQWADQDVGRGGPESDHDQTWTRYRMLRLIDALPDDERLIVLRHAAYGVSFTQLAKELGISRQAVHKKFSLIKQRLNAEFDGLHESEDRDAYWRGVALWYESVAESGEAA